ncbi:cysteine--tRNA ligase [Mycoplasma struthionis]|uniref:Cysteine--tRNA ligase n=1 Tax=Mycoplasma struthionis TaxID=538220 RepID=A0A3G8LHQ8_9MOLU|nr:cysteine--tRNA ligase [Mycoplasma struthionis]AZG68402.1 cysteine--tRNA ligase [Mycoplasma struthionis]
MKRYYLCGPTVYNYPHIGNMRPIVTFDLMIRSQRYLGEEVYFLHNITDIDDKIILKAKQENKTEKEISSYYEAYYLNLFKTFNLEMPTKIIRVTDSLNDMYEYINELIKVEAAYRIGGNIFFDVAKYKDIYGTISNQKLEALKHVEDDGALGKKNSFDFTLWKDTTDGIKFSSPWGLGRPGWHTECSCFIYKYFNKEQLDIHGGGIDLIFPHHENENIQHYALTEQNIAKDWIHFGTLNYKNEKMSKSIGNIIYPHNFLEDYDADSYKLLMLTTNYSKPINVTEELLEVNQNQINKLKTIVKKIQLLNLNLDIDKNLVNELINKFAKLDFANGYRDLIALIKKQDNWGTLKEVFRILGFNFVYEVVSEEDINLYKNWNELIAKKDYSEADKLREMLIKKGLL